jgi:hypothetical protein
MDMPQLNVTITEDLDDRIRKKAGKRFGASKVTIKLAVVEALEDYIKNPAYDAEFQAVKE